MKELIVNKIDCEELLGTFLDESHYDLLIEEDCDVYAKPFIGDNQNNGEHNIILKFRKNYFTKEQQEGAYDGLMEAAKTSQNRGLAAGTRAKKLQGRDWVTDAQLLILKNLERLPDNDNEMSRVTESDIDQWKLIAGVKPENRGLVWLGSEREKYNFTFDIWLSTIFNISNKQIKKEVQWIQNTLISDTTYANPVDSGIAGWFGRYPRIPYGRPTAYTFYNFEKFKKSYPFLKNLAKGFETLLPQRYENQINCVKRLDPQFYVPETPFTTITVNKNFRTAAHRDAGDLATGFSNLTVVAKNNNYKGGYLILPEIRAAVNLRPGDLLLVSNHEYIHGNTPILSESGFELERISLVCYFREDMLELGTKEYEDQRFNFVEHRRKSKEHSEYRTGWNGVSANMWESEEWYDFLRKNGKPYMLEKYHPNSLQKEQNYLENFF
jgi:hypothetical protein